MATLTKTKAPTEWPPITEAVAYREADDAVTKKLDALRALGAEHATLTRALTGDDPVDAIRAKRRLPALEEDAALVRAELVGLVRVRDSIRRELAESVLEQAMAPFTERLRRIKRAWQTLCAEVEGALDVANSAAAAAGDDTLTRRLHDCLPAFALPATPHQAAQFEDWCGQMKLNGWDI